MAAFTPWIGRLVESELENIIAWKSVVKAEPGASEEDAAPRFSDDGSNLRSFVGCPPLGSESMLQLLQVHFFHNWCKDAVTDKVTETRLERSRKDTNV